MPSRLKRIYGFRDLHFITCSCYRRQPLLGAKHTRDVFLRIFEQVRRKYKFEVVGYVVMPEAGWPTLSISVPPGFPSCGCPILRGVRRVGEKNVEELLVLISAFVFSNQNPNARVALCEK